MLEIKPASLNDCYILSDICLKTDPIYKDILPNAFKKQAKKFEEYGLPNNYDIFLINDQNNTIGFIGLKNLSKDIAYLVAIYIYPEYQHNGYGKNSLNLIINQLKRDNIKKLLLLVHSKAEWAINFYLNYGFTAVYDKLDDIENYCDCILKGYALPSTVLMNFNLV